MHVTIMATPGSIASHSRAGTSDQLKSCSSTCRTVTRRATPTPMSKMPSPKMSDTATLSERGICSRHVAGMGSDQMVSSRVRPHAATAATIGTWARHVPGSVMSQFLDKGMHRKETIKIEKRIQSRLTMLQARTSSRVRAFQVLYVKDCLKRILTSSTKALRDEYPTQERAD